MGGRVEYNSPTESRPISKPAHFSPDDVAGAPLDRRQNLPHGRGLSKYKVSFALPFVTRAKRGIGTGHPKAGGRRRFVFDNPLPQKIQFGLEQLFQSGTE